MTAAHLHLMLNHISVIGIPISTGVLLYGMVRHNQGIVKLALTMTFILALATIPIYLTGEPAEETIEHLPGVVESFIENHEDAALYAFVMTLITGALAFGALVWSNAQRMLLRLTLLGLIFSISSLLWTARLGGEIRHPEIRRESSASAPTTAGDINKEGEGEDDD